ncbi:hypothetical protein [Geminocystis sp. GBBB08]|uniref:hypothetical protein n=1 Tax=Geminocystis sp. GBBB08 TaxID=2604140 RepID=UPI0027E35E5B|nr:hypothetical protein [Geminocystis sp. GBBB08]
MRLHIKDKDSAYNEETFMRSYSKTLAHLLREKHLANAQGFYLGENESESGKNFRIKNSLSSLYSLLPKKITVTESSYQPQLEKLALIIVSSREADANYKGGKRIANLYGEVVKIVKENGKVTVRNDFTFSANYNKEEMYKNPTVLVNQVDRLYREGFKHFLYIAIRVA